MVKFPSASTTPLKTDETFRYVGPRVPKTAYKPRVIQIDPNKPGTPIGDWNRTDFDSNDQVMFRWNQMFMQRFG